MRQSSLPLFTYSTHGEIEKAIQALGKSGFDITKLSVVGRAHHSEERPIGFYTAGGRMKAWGSAGAFWGGIWGMLLAPAVFWVPGLGLLAMAGPVATALLGAVEGAAVGGGLSVLGATLSRIGVPHDDVIKFETTLKADQYVLMVHGSLDDIIKVRAILAHTPQLQAA